MDNYNNTNWGNGNPGNIYQNGMNNGPMPPHRRPEKKEKGFGAGMGAGIAIGCAIMLAISIVVSVVFISMSPSSSKNTVSSTDVIDSDTASKLSEVMDAINTYYYEDVDKDDLQTSLVKGLVEGLNDPYSEYLTADEYAEMMESNSGSYYGIGAGLTQDQTTKQVTVTKIYAGTPSEEAGMKKDDVILTVNDMDTTQMELSDVVAQIRGEENTTVHITAYRPSTGENLEFDVTRKNVELPSVESQMMDNSIGYIQVSQFMENTATQFDSQLTALENQGMKGLIIDLRSNPGGLVTAVVDMCERILPATDTSGPQKGCVVYTEDKYGQTVMYGEDDGKEADYPIVVLVNGDSASASEIFAGAMKDYTANGDANVTIVGTTTYGKGIVQTFIPLKDGDALKVTTSKYYTPNGSNIHGVGIDPDVEVEYEYSGPADQDYDKQYDSQVQKAIEVMNEKLQ